MEILQSIFDAASTTLDLADFAICVGGALLVGLIIAAFYMFRNSYSQSMAVTLALMPAIVTVIILVVNGNIGAGIAVAGAFSLVRFRSAPGSAKEIVMIFLAMSTGLLIGMGFIAYALLFAAIIGVANLIYNTLGKKAGPGEKKQLRITIPEDLDYSSRFDDVFSKYTTSCELRNVKTTNMGTLYKLTYLVTVKDISSEKMMIDELRTRNGNLEISVSYPESDHTEL